MFTVTGSTLLLLFVALVGVVAFGLGVFTLSRWMTRPADSEQRLAPSIVLLAGGMFIASLPWTWTGLQGLIGQMFLA